MNPYKFFITAVSFFIIFSFVSIILFPNTAFGESVTYSDDISYRPQIISNEKDLFIVWTERSETNSEVFFTMSNDRGLTFSEPKNLSNNHGNSAFPRIVESESGIFVTWYDYTPGQSDIFFAKSYDFGNSFVTLNMSDNITSSFNPWIAVESDHVYLVWNDGGKSQRLEFPNGQTKIVDVLMGDSEIMFGTSDDRGKTFEIKNISDMPGDSLNPRMRTEENNVYVVWTDRINNSEIFFSKSNDFGNSFSEPLNVSNSDSLSFDAGIQISEENIFLIWKEKNNNNSEIYFSKSDNGGNSFSDPKNISNNFGNNMMTRDMQIGVSMPHIFIVYYDEKTSDVYLSHSPDMGTSFYNPLNISTNNGTSIFPQLVADKNKIFVIWNDDSDGDVDVYLRESFDYGYTFGPKINLSDGMVESNLFILGPQISKSDDYLDVVWENKNNSKSNLFLKQREIPNSSLIIMVSNSDVLFSLDGNEIQPGKETLIEMKFTDANKKIINANHSLSILDSKNNLIFQSPFSIAVNGTATHLMIFPESDQYSVSVDIDEETIATGDEILIHVIPEFPFGVIFIFSVLFMVILFSKKINPTIFG